jgi:hypothetical protein
VPGGRFGVVPLQGLVIIRRVKTSAANERTVRGCAVSRVTDLRRSSRVDVMHRTCLGNFDEIGRGFTSASSPHRPGEIRRSFRFVAGIVEAPVFRTFNGDPVDTLGSALNVADGRKLVEKIGP